LQFSTYNPGLNVHRFITLEFGCLLLADVEICVLEPSILPVINLRHALDHLVFMSRHQVGVPAEAVRLKPFEGSGGHDGLEFLGLGLLLA
jgi:hypothetical protein